VANMISLKNLLIAANRLKSLPASFTGITLSNFSCPYNFLDMSPGSTDRNIIDSMTVSSMFSYQDQLQRLEGLKVEYPDTGVAKFSWDAGEDITFSTGFEAKLNRVTILQDGDYIDSLTPDILEYEITNLAVGQEYEFSFSFDYNIMDTRYEDQYTRTYTQIEVTPIRVVEATPTPTSEPAPTLAPTPTPELTPTQESWQKPTETIKAANDTEGEEIAIQTTSTFAAATIILLVVIGILILALIVIIILFIKKKS